MCKSCDMNAFFNLLPEEEQQRVNNLELFDEYEEWHLKCSHYIILCAFNGQCRVLTNQILPCSTVYNFGLYPCFGPRTIDAVDRISPSSVLKRCEHFRWCSVYIRVCGYNVFMKVIENICKCSIMVPVYVQLLNTLA